MTNYRLDLLHADGRVIDKVELQFDSDEAAEAEVASHLRGWPAELWRGPVLVRRFTRAADKS